LFKTAFPAFFSVTVLCPAVLKEALRRYSVVPVVTRSLKEDDMLGGQPVPAGAMIVCHIQVRVCVCQHLHVYVCVEKGGGCVVCRTA
jgi:hypothetical protein